MTISTALLHSAFYRFTPLADPALAAATLRPLARGLGGSIVLAGEGINGVVAGAPADVAAFEAALQRTDVLGGALRAMAFQHSACSSPPFGRLKIGVKPEIVALGLPAGANPGPLPAPDDGDASHLDPLAWRALLGRADVVVLDNRNHFEFRLGHFRGAVDPQVHNFRDFAAYVQAQAPAWRDSGRPVAMYCTGGIRCDKTAPWMRSLGLDVWQLGGGILRYLDAVQRLGEADPHWQGACFVFDKRMALDRHLHETGTTAAQVFDPAHPDEAWRLQRATQLNGPLG